MKAYYYSFVATDANGCDLSGSGVTGFSSLSNAVERHLRTKTMTLIEVFLANPALQNDLRNALNVFAEICASSAEAKGFCDNEKAIADALGLDTPEDLVQWIDDAILQAELARQMSEIGEAVEAVRKPGLDSHLPEFPAFLVEEADVVIRIADTCGKRDLKLGDAIIAKMLYNAGRPYMHGKKS